VSRARLLHERPQKLEWVGARYSLGRLVDDGKSHPPDVLYWLELPGEVLVGSNLCDPHDPAAAAESLEKAMQQPADGVPRRPARIRVRDHRFADEVRDAAEGIPIAVGPVPELDAIFAELQETLRLEAASRHAAESVPVTGRNDPCPCGSGKKYKKCHLDADQAPRQAAAQAETVHQMDHRLLGLVARFAASRFSVDWMVEFDLVDLPESAMTLILPWITWTIEAKGRSVADVYVEEHRAGLTTDEREWFAGQRASWIGVWEVTAVAPGRIDARDLLTGETRSVTEEAGSRTARVRDTILARVIDHRGRSYFGGMYSRPLRPSLADMVVNAVRMELDVREATIPVERLRSSEIGWLLIEEWTAAVEEDDVRRSIPPTLQNTDGEPLQFVTDSFSFDVSQRPEIQERLETTEGFASTETKGDFRAHYFVRASDETFIGTVIVGSGELHIQTNSLNRADALGQQVREACAGVLHDYKRTIQQPPAPTIGAEASAMAAAEPSAEEMAMTRELKADYYRKWLDLPVPALRNQTPREASRSAESRRALDLLLRDMENLESRVPEEERVDIASLRGELGLEP
jgi:hypothetical protein